VEFTLRQFQRLISAAKKQDGRIYPPSAATPTICDFAKAVWDVKLDEPVVTRTGRLIERRDMNRKVSCPSRTIDRLVRLHGPNTPLSKFIERAPDPPPSMGGGGGSEDNPFSGDPDSVCREANAANESPQHDEPWEPTPPPPEQAPPPKTKEEKQADLLQQLREQLKQLQQGQPPADNAYESPQLENRIKKARFDAIKRLQAEIRDAAKKQSKMADVRGKTSGPSLDARRRAAGTHGRLRRVPTSLRNRTADIINRLVSETGVAGDRLSPIPVLSPRKVVKRMIVRRSLSNALKEDCNSGRPVTLFLPDVSPSCERQAQIACDISNAAGYAGVSGSDVLVFPHSNGEVESEYVPWFNGRPKLVHKQEVQALFREITTGAAAYDIRVVVAIGDHDAVELYGQIAERRQVRRFVWLHNWATDNYRPQVTPPDSLAHLPWSLEAKAKTTFVAGCVNQETILGGLELSLK
jgi:hypothetical protein